MEKANVYIAIPNLGSIDPRLVMVLLRWVTMGAEGADGIIVIMPTGQIPHDGARNYCVKEFLKTKCTHLFFLDHDVIPPVETLSKLLAADKDVISGLYPSMKFDKYRGVAVKRNNVFRYGIDDHGEQGLLHAFRKEEDVEPIDHCGGGCLLIKRKVLEDMPAPWFKFHYDDEGVMNWGEDIAFGKLIRERGIQLYGHFGVQCNHVKDVML